MTAPLRIDLHTHSSTSDGTDEPAGLVRKARGAGLDVVALTDHDTYDGIEEAHRAAGEYDIAFVPGIELSCEYEGRSVHVLGYGGDPQHPDLSAELEAIRRGRRDRVPAMIQLLDALGLHLTTEQVQEQVGDAPSVGRPHVADALVVAGYVPDRSAAFSQYLAEGRPAYVGRYAPTVEQGVALLRAAGAVAVIAHPWGRDSRHVLDPDTLVGFLHQGVAGLEVDHVEHDAEDRARLRELALSHDVLVTGSSDYHGTGKSNNPLGACTTDPAMYERLLELVRSAH